MRSKPAPNQAPRFASRLQIRDKKGRGQRGVKTKPANGTYWKRRGFSPRRQTTASIVKAEVFVIALQLWASGCGGVSIDTWAINGCACTYGCADVWGGGVCLSVCMCVPMWTCVWRGCILMSACVYVCTCARHILFIYLKWDELNNLCICKCRNHIYVYNIFTYIIIYNNIYYTLTYIYTHTYIQCVYVYYLHTETSSLSNHLLNV